MQARFPAAVAMQARFPAAVAMPARFPAAVPMRAGGDRGVGVDLTPVLPAIGVFAATNVDDLLVLAVFFGRARGRRGSSWRIAAGQYAGFVAIVAAALLGAAGAGLLPDAAIPYLGLLPLFLGLRAAWTTWRRHRDADPGEEPPAGPGVLQVATVTFANGGDNIGVYVPLFTVSGPAGAVTYVIVFLLGVAVWCAAAWFLATRPVVAAALARWGHLILPAVLIAIGLTILIQGHAFGL
jgi:cadmium resistance protein CadD (predicted permease)